MKEIFYIGEVAALLGVPKATLRFWEDQGLLPRRRADNGYRQFSIQDLVALLDVIHYRELHLPIRTIRGLPDKSLGELDEMLAASEAALEKEITLLRLAQKNTRRRRTVIERARCLAAEPYRLTGAPPIERVVNFEMEEQEKLNLYLEDPSTFTQVLFGRGTEPRAIFCGLEVRQGQFSREPSLWQNEGGQWVHFLFRCVEGQEDRYLCPHLEKLEAQGWQVGEIVARFLLPAASDGEYMDFYEAWAQVEPQSPQI